MNTNASHFLRLEYDGPQAASPLMLAPSSACVGGLADGIQIRTRLLARLENELALLPNDWDGEGSPAPSAVIVENARKLIYALPWEALLRIDDEDALMPMPGGRLTLDWYYPDSPRRVISIEIAKNGCGAYVRPPARPSVYFDAFEADQIPSGLHQLMIQLFG